MVDNILYAVISVTIFQQLKPHIFCIQRKGNFKWSWKCTNRL